MKIEMEDGTKIEIPKMWCPSCFLDKLKHQPIPKMPKLEVTAKLMRKGEKVEVRVCPKCGHKQVAVVDAWT